MLVSSRTRGVGLIPRPAITVRYPSMHTSRINGLVAAIEFSLAFAAPAQGADAVLTARVIDAQTGRIKATFNTSAPISTPPIRQTFVHRREVHLPKPIGRVSVVAQIRFLGFSKNAVWFALTSDATTTGRRNPAVRRVINARASVPYGSSHTIEDLFSADGRRLSLVITPSKDAPHKPPSLLSRIFRR